MVKNQGLIDSTKLDNTIFEMSAKNLDECNKCDNYCVLKRESIFLPNYTNTSITKLTYKNDKILKYASAWSAATKKN